KASILLVAETERDERGFLEFGRELLFRPVVHHRKRFGQARDLERALAKVVRLLRVEQENAVRHFRFGHDERDDRFGAELAHRAEAVIAVRRPVLALAGRHGDHRIEVAIELVDRIRDALHVRRREIALKGRGFDDVERERREDLPVAAEWISIGREHGAAVILDGATERRHGYGRRGGSQSSSIEAARCGGSGGALLFASGHWCDAWIVDRGSWIVTA